mgnify:CR=1 FL=1
MSAQSRYFNDISSFATNPKRNEIIKDIETLISKPHNNPKKQANKIHGLQTKWQQLDQTSKPAGREQWITFKKLTDKAWEPCAQYYEELKTIKIKNAAEREKIIQNLLNYAAENSDKWPGLIEMSRHLTKTFQLWQSFAPVLDEDFTKLKAAYQHARKPINDAIRDQESKNYKLKEAMIEKVKLINDDDNQACIQKFKRIKRDYQDIGPAGKKNEAVLWKLLNESADRFFEAEKAKANNEIEIINTLFDDLKKEDCSIQNIKEQMRELSKTRKSPEFIKLKKAIKLLGSNRLPQYKIGLCMIVKDESHIIHESLEATLPFIDTFSILDTGSTDNTVQIIRDFYTKHNIPGNVNDFYECTACGNIGIFLEVDKKDSEKVQEELRKQIKKT